jgi:hypothetical protein
LSKFGFCEACGSERISSEGKEMFGIFKTQALACHLAGFGDGAQKLILACTVDP